MAKNSVTVGATENGAVGSWPSPNNLWAEYNYGSSRGPTADGRIKPEVLSPGKMVTSARYNTYDQYWGQGGTSMAAPGVAGSAALIRQYFEDGWYPSGFENPPDGFTPSAALLKAMLVQSATEITGDYAYENGHFYPNYDQGWGRVQLNEAMDFFDDEIELMVVDDTYGLYDMDTAIIPTQFEVDDGGPFEVSLVWTDYPGGLWPTPSIVHNLDLRVIDPVGNVYLGNVYDPTSHESVPNIGSADVLNVVESVLVNSPAEGVWTIEVSANHILNGPQPFALVVTGKPKIDFSTYLGTAGYEGGVSIAVDSEGYVYITGTTWAPVNFPMPESNAFDTTYNGGWDVFVAKFNPDGSDLLYATFLGGGDSDRASDIAVDSSGLVYVLGETRSTNFPIEPIPGAFQETNNGDFDAFLTVLDLQGNGDGDLLYSTYFGGSNYDVSYTMQLDSSGNVHFVGDTTSTETDNFPLSSGAYDITHNGDYDAYFTKLYPGGGGTADLIYSSFLGGSEEDRGFSIAVDTSGFIYLTGRTKSTENSLNPFPTKFEVDSTHNGGYDVFITKIRPMGFSMNDLWYSTFLGDSGNDVGESIAVDLGDRAYVTGSTDSQNFPTTLGAYSEVPFGYRDAFLVRLNPLGNTLLYSTYLGGLYEDVGNTVAVDVDTYPYIIGRTCSDDFPTTSNAFDETFNSPGGFPFIADAFVTKISPFGAGLGDLLYSTFVGGTGYDNGKHIALGSPHNAYITGSTDSIDFPVVFNAYDPTYNDGGDAFVTKLLIP